MLNNDSIAGVFVSFTTIFRIAILLFYRTAVPNPIKTGYFQDPQNLCWGSDLTTIASMKSGTQSFP